MNPKKAYGVETTLGRAIAEHAAEGRLKAAGDAAAFKAVLHDVPSPLPPALLDEWFATFDDAQWKRVRAKLLLGAKLAQGKVREKSDDDVERTGVGGGRA